jgi:HD-like signal output (HDOD) protein
MILNENAFQQIVWNIEHIGTPHSVSLKLLEKTSNPDYTASDLADIISQEPTVAAQILKIANSVHFSRMEPVKTIKQAVIKLGSSNIRSILFSIEMFGVFRGNCSSERFKEPEFWKHSVAGAIIASKYAQFDKSITDSDIVYAAALIRNIGVLAMRQYIPGEFEQMLTVQSTEGFPFEFVSKAIIGVSHRHVAYMIGLRWSLPRSIIEAIDDRINPYEQSRESSEIRKAIVFADDLLQVTKFGVWDQFYMPGNVDFHDVPCEEIFNEASTIVSKMFEEYWT